MPFLLALALWQCAIPSRATAMQAVPRFPSSAEVVKVTAVVTGARGRPPAPLRREDFEVWADGRRQEIAYFSTPADAAPVDVALAVDTSGSMASAHDQVTRAAVGFLYEVPGARLRLLASFDKDVRFWKTGTPASDLVQQMNEAAAPRGATALRGAVHAILKQLGGTGRAAVVVLTDGDDQGSIVGPDELRALLQSSNVTVYPVRYDSGSDAPWGFARRALQEMARETGGRVFDGERLKPADIFQEITADLGSQYVLGFVPRTRRRGMHTLRVTVRGGTVRHRTAYRVGPPDAPEPGSAANLSAIARQARGQVGLSAVLVETGERLHLQGDGRFPMQSVFKLPVALQVLHLVDEGKLRLDEPVRLAPSAMRRGRSPLRDAHPEGVTLTVEALLEWMLVEGDNSAADALLRLGGGPAAVTARLRGLGIEGVRVDRGEAELARDLLDGGPGAFAAYLKDPRDTAQPDAMADLLVAIARGRELRAAGHERLLGWMTGTKTGLQRIRGLLPAGTPVADRTGGGPDRKGVNSCTNDVGIITLPDGRHVALAVFTKASRAGADQRERTIARLARAVYDHWVPAPAAR
jgi:beta-lactamase class A